MNRRADSALIGAPAPHASLIEPAPPSASQAALDVRLIRRLYGFTRPYARRRNLLLVASCVRALQTPALSWAAAATIAGPIAHGDGARLVQCLVAIALLALSSLVALHYRVKHALELGEAVIGDLRLAVLRHLLSLPLSFFATQRLGKLLSHFSSDLEVLRSGVKDVAFVVLIQLVSMLAACAVMAFYDWRSFLIVAAVLPGLWLVLQLLRRKLSAAHRAAQESYGKLNAAVAESINGIRTTLAYVRGALNTQLFTAQANKHAQLSLAAARRAGVLAPLLELNAQACLAVLLVVGAQRALQHQLKLEVLLQFFALSKLVFQPLGMLGAQYQQALAASAGAERIFELLDTATQCDAPGSHPLARVTGSVEVRNVSFEYIAGRPVLCDVGLCAAPGECVAIVGPTGSGKTTLLSLLAKFHAPQSGAILVDGHDLRVVSADSLRRQLGYVPQDCFLFSGSVLDNIRIARPDASDEDILRAARALDVIDLLEGLPQGWETPLGERGTGLSLGQRQIVCFARTMLADPRILLLDEATSALDARSEERLQTALKQLMVGRTSFVVAHRLSTILHADQVIVLQRGRIVERGTPASLQARDGTYARLYRQSRG